MSCKLPHPIQYQGSKRNLAPAILSYMPKKVERLIEPFAGSAAISIATAAQNLTDTFIINDLNAPLIELLKMIVDEPEKTSAQYAEIWHQQHDDSLGHYYQIRSDFNKTGNPVLFLYLLSRCVKGSVRYNSEGQFNQSPDKRRKGAMPETVRRNIFGVSRLLKGKVVFRSEDYKKVIENAQKGDLVYMDPPYQGVCGERDNRYFSGIRHEDFIEALKHLTTKEIDFIVSYDGRRGTVHFGEQLPDFLELTRVELEAGRSSQSTLLGRDEHTVESLYISRSLALQQKKVITRRYKQQEYQLNLIHKDAVYA